MKIYFELMTLLLVSWYENSAQQSSIFEAFLPQWRIGRDLLLNVLTPTSKNPANLRKAEELHKLQPKISDDTPFPCSLNNTRSKKRPKSVHALRPGDIDVVGAIGDSLTAGNGLASTNILHVVLENRGISFTIGGQGTWRQFVTLPNILKEFNPHLVGYSLQDSFGHHSAAQFNTAEPGAISIDTPYMAKVLINRMKGDSRIDIAKDWKMITYMIGPNDFCGEMCHRKNPEAIVEEHRRDLLKVLRTLRDNLPRTIVNLVVTPKIMTKWQQMEIEVGNDPEFDREDFTVVVQPFAVNYNLHTTKRGLTDYSALAEDCFHLSQKEGARAALSLWNNIVEPVGRKSTQPSELFNFKCPVDYPFIFTRRNSK